MPAIIEKRKQYNIKVSEREKITAKKEKSPKKREKRAKTPPKKVVEEDSGTCVFDEGAGDSGTVVDMGPADDEASGTCIDLGEPDSGTCVDLGPGSETAPPPTGKPTRGSARASRESESGGEGSGRRAAAPRPSRRTTAAQ